MQKQLVVSGVTVNAALKYKAGDVLTSEEASALNQLVFSEVSTKLKKLVTAHVKEKGDLSEEAKENFSKKFDELCQTFSFTLREATNTFDPIMLEARKIALPKVLEVLAKKGISRDALTKEELENYVSTAITKQPLFLEEARRRYNALREVAGKTLEG